jgi:hypothetical protein
MTDLNQKPRDASEGQYPKFEKIGDSVTGRVIDYAESAGKFNKPQLTMKTKDGTKLVSCSKDLQKTLEDNGAKNGDLDGKVLYIKLIELRAIEGRENKMKVYSVKDVTAEHGKAPAAPPPPPPAEDDADIPF